MYQSLCSLAARLSKDSNLSERSRSHGRGTKCDTKPRKHKEPRRRCGSDAAVTRTIGGDARGRDNAGEQSQLAGESCSRFCGDAVNEEREFEWAVTRAASAASVSAFPPPAPAGLLGQGRRIRVDDMCARCAHLSVYAYVRVCVYTRTHTSTPAYVHTPAYMRTSLHTQYRFRCCKQCRRRRRECSRHEAKRMDCMHRSKILQRLPSSTSSWRRSICDITLPRLTPCPRSCGPTSSVLRQSPAQCTRNSGS